MTSEHDPGADMTLEQLAAEQQRLLVQGMGMVERLREVTEELRAQARGEKRRGSRRAR